MTYGDTREEAISNTEKLAIEAIADRIRHGEMPASSLNLSFSIMWHGWGRQDWQMPISKFATLKRTRSGVINKKLDKCFSMRYEQEWENDENDSPVKRRMRKGTWTREAVQCSRLTMRGQQS